MEAHAFFAVNQPDTVHETFDDETVLLNLKSGTYYSLDSVGAEVWTLIESGQDFGGMTEALSKRYSMAADELMPHLRCFLQELLEEDLIVKGVPQPGAREEVSGGGNPGNGAASGQPFVPPRLCRYTDMQDLFLLDPIHEVTDSGWPKAPGGAGPGQAR